MSASNDKAAAQCAGVSFIFQPVPLFLQPLSETGDGEYANNNICVSELFLVKKPTSFVTPVGTFNFYL